jgi:hypothetical protein
MFLNKVHAKRREELGKNTQLIDESMLARGDMQDSKATRIEGAENTPQRRLDEDNALHDMTDVRNEDFIYVY